jgi:hypothetical protein
VDDANGSKSAAFRQRQAEFSSLGGRLKHTKDDIIRSRGPSPLSPGEEKRVAALHFEMILSYMVAFKALNQARALDHKVSDLKTWETLLPHFPELRHRLRKCRPLLALAVQMQAVCLEEITHAFMTLDRNSAINLHPSWAKHEKKRPPTWAEAFGIQSEFDDSRMKATLGPWSSVDDAVSAALLIMRRWAERENVNWRPEIPIPLSNSG